MVRPAGEVTSISPSADRFLGARWMVIVNVPAASQSPHCKSCSGIRSLPPVSLDLVVRGSYLKILAPFELAARPYAVLSERLLSTMSPDLRTCAHARKGSAYKGARGHRSPIRWARWAHHTLHKALWIVLVGVVNQVAVRFVGRRLRRDLLHGDLVLLRGVGERKGHGGSHKGNTTRTAN